MTRSIKKIVFLTFEFYPQSAGVANATLSLSRALATRGIDVLVITPKNNREWKRREDLDGRLHVLRISKLLSTRSPLNRVYFMARATLAIRKFKPDVIVGQMLNWGGVIAGIAGKLTRRMSVGYAHAAWDTEACYGFLNRFLRSIALRWCDVILATNSFHRDALDVVLPGVRDKSRVVPNIVDDISFTLSREECRQKLELPDEGFDLINIGRLSPSKGQSYAVDAMRHLPEDTRLHMIGDGELHDQLVRQAEEAGVSDRIIFHGVVDRETVFAFMQGADAMVFPGRWEGFSMTVIEALYLGCPVITTAVGGLADMVKDRKTGLVVQRADPEDIARAVTELRTDPELREALSRQGRKRVHNEYNSDRVLREFLTSLEDYSKK